MNQPPPQTARSNGGGLSIRWKLLGATVIVGLVTASIAIVGLVRIQAVNDALTRILDYSAEKAKLASLVKQDLVTITRAERNLILAKSEEEIRRYTTAIDETLLLMDRRLAALRELVDDADQRLLNDFTTRWDEWLDNHQSVRRFAELDTEARARNLSVNEARSAVERLERALRRIARGAPSKPPAAPTGDDSPKPPATAGTRDLAWQLLYRVAQMRRVEKDLILASDKAALQRHEAELESLFERMRNSLHDRRRELAALNAALKRRTDEMEQFVYTISHDLKSPLVSCKGLLGLLREDIRDGNAAEVEHSLERLDQATDQLGRIIDDLLSLSRIGRKQLNRTVVDVRSLVLELHEELNERIREAGAELQLEGQLPPLTADAADLKRVLENLVTNALKYACDAPGAVIQVGGRDGDGEVCLFVRDEGPGIDPKYHDRIFGLFQRLDTTKPGTGLGLASAAKIVQMHGGRIWVESAIGRGATFWVAFPKNVAALRANR